MKRRFNDGDGDGDGDGDEIARLIRKTRECGQTGGGAENKKQKKSKKKRRMKDKKEAELASAKEDQQQSQLLKKEVCEDEDDEYPYSINSGDHCETPVEAYEHIAGVLEALALKLGKTRDTLSIYDPYYCEGGMVQRLLSLGFHNVYNRKEDFYERVAKQLTPSFDVLVTNPPYSGEHVSRLLEFCNSSEKPWFVLVPSYCYTKPYYAEHLLVGSKKRMFYIAPKRRYLYLTPKGRRQQKSSKVTSPFVTFWYCCVPSTLMATSDVSMVVRSCVLTSEVDLAFGTPSGLPTIHLDERDPKRKRIKNANKRKKNKEKRKVTQKSKLTV